MRTSLKLSAAGVALALALSGCSSSGDLDSIDFKDQGKDKAPSISFDTPLKVDDPETRVLKDGDGADVKAGDTIVVDASLYNGADQKSLGDTYSSQPMTIKLTDDVKKKMPELYDVMTSHKVGTTFAFAQSPKESQQQQGSAASAGADDASTVEVYRIQKKILKSAEGETVKPRAGMPQVSIEGDKDPKITIPKNQPEPTTLTTEELIKGNGETVKGDDTVYVRYSGVRWEDGKQFDSNWNKDAASFSLGQVIKGWSEGLKGKKVGDRIVMEIPADKAYGTKKELGKDSKQPAGALVFVVDILGRDDAAPSAHETQSAKPSDGASGAASSAAPSASASDGAKK